MSRMQSSLQDSCLLCLSTLVYHVAPASMFFFFFSLIFFFPIKQLSSTSVLPSGHSVSPHPSLPPAAESLSPAWLSLVVHPQLHSSLCGLLARTAVLLRLASTSGDALQHFCDPSSLQTSSRELCRLLAQNGVHLAPALTAAAAAADAQQTV